VSDLKLFRVSDAGVVELEGSAVPLERSLQQLFERNLEALLGVRFLASEHSTGVRHGGRIDTLGLDENGLPVIIEYKRQQGENVINQGLFYLDWLMDHKGEFELLVTKQLGQEAGEGIEWSPRLLCIAGDFTRYDVHAVQQINRTIELIRYRRYGDDLILLEQVNTPTPASAQPSQTPARESGAASGEAAVSERRSPSGRGRRGADSTIDDRLANADAATRALFDELKSRIEALGDDVQMKTLKHYYAFKRLKNFACVEVFPRAGTVAAYVKVDPDTVDLEEGFTRDVRQIGHFGTGNLEIVLRRSEDLDRAEPLLRRSYEGS
jgi:predicted transport protein